MVLSKVHLALFVIILGSFWVVYAQIDNSPNNQAFLFAADAEQLLSQPLVTSFSCQNRDYGYYADVDNNCEVKLLEKASPRTHIGTQKERSFRL